jgi:dolichol-phosphate mannosyltransferase
MREKFWAGEPQGLILQVSERLTALARAHVWCPPLLSIIVPTFNERDNVPELVRRIDECLIDIAWEVVFVDDDSPDGTLRTLHALSRLDPRVRVLHRVGRRGLASAVVEGILSTTAPYIAVMDADLQHDESILPSMLDRLRSSDTDIVLGTRYTHPGGVEGLKGRRRLVSSFATKLAHVILRTKVSDPMSGFFMLKREAFDRSVRRLSTIGYKIFLDIVVSAHPPLTVAEIPYVFRNRIHGESKLDFAVTWEYLLLLLDKKFGRIASARLVTFLGVGGLGVFVHMFVLAILSVGLNGDFFVSQSTATLVAMTFNFFANNMLTYYDKRLKGFLPIVRGLLSFYAVCSIGAFSNVGIASVLFARQHTWWLSGLSGIVVGAVWNYAASSTFTWRK